MFRGQQTLLWREGCCWHVCYSGASPCYAGQGQSLLKMSQNNILSHSGSSNTERNQFCPSLWQWSDGGSEVLQEVQGDQQHQRPEPGLGPLLPRVQEDLEAAASVDSAGAAVRVSQAVDVQRLGAGHPRVIPAQQTYLQNIQLQLQSPGETSSIYIKHRVRSFVCSSVRR